MTLFQATLLTGLFLIALGAYFLWHGSHSAINVQAFPRSKTAAYILLGSATAWFLYKITQLGPADFGQYKNILFVVFLLTAIGSFIYVPDFLAVRGLSALVLLISGTLLEAAYMELPTTRLFLVSFVYTMIITAIILGASPFKLRDFLDWLYLKEIRPRIFGGIFVFYGILLVGVTITY